MRCLVDPELNRGETDLFHHIYQRAAENLPKVGHLPPAAFFRAGLRAGLPGLKPGNIAVMQFDIPGHDAGKDVLIEMIKAFARKVDADLAILLLESWMIKPNAEEAEHIKNHGEFLVRPSKHPHRIEIVMISVSKPGGHNWSAWVEIQRNGKGAPSIAAQPPALEYVKSDGRFANILDGGGNQPSLS